MEEDEMGRTCSTHLEEEKKKKKKNVYTIMVENRERKRPLGRHRHRHRWEYIKMDLGEIGWGGIDWIDLAQDRDQWKALLNTVMNFRVP
jgi:hypothetical protein